MSKLDIIWQQMESDSSIDTLSYQNTGSPSAQLLAGVRRVPGGPTNRAVLLRLPVHLVRKVVSSDRNQGLRLDPLEDQNAPGYGFVALVLTKGELRDIFTILATDMLEVVGPITVQADQLRAFLKRLSRWQDLLNYYSPGGLSAPARQGLFGELWAMRWLLAVGNVPASPVLSAWVGPERAPQDFQFPGTALEVKTTSGGSNTLCIGGLWQLESVAATDFFLLHIPLVNSASGESLPVLVADLVERFALDPVLGSRFEARLLTAGYLHSQAAMYKDEKWSVKPTRLMTVSEDFPRLRTHELPAAITAATYELDAGALDPWLCHESTLFTLLY
ncbi:PD-(D/E)XK motif protein [Hymenobacter sp. AT01-02]|uniref:PD-(D/E)XK motif protein n=1 Tax=Hymenobacter sp. AT01-02 TaxID=1571877 RepID=UPI0005F23A14|nr:PD-(D/E)XK motif protein [Hymenobacter sp. AT01-02]